MKLYGVALRDSDDRVVINYKKDGHFEPESVYAWENAMRIGHVAIDVGAYTGLYALIASRCGCDAIAYEPNPVVRNRLLQNIALNGVAAVKGITVMECAASDKKERRELWIKHDMTSAGRFQKHEGATSVMVDCVPIAVPAKPVCAIKIDVEGAEMAVLLGARELLLRDKPLVIAEVLKPGRAERLSAYMEELGYSCCVADGRNLICTA